MGGSAAGGNAQLFDLMNQYGTNGAGNGSGNTYAGMSMNDALTAEQNRQIRAGAGNGQGDPKFDDFSLLFSAISAFNGGNGGGGLGMNRPPNGGGLVIDKPGQRKYQWQFPKYSQSWAFTPPTPSPYLYPKPFDPAIYGNPFSKKPNK